ncbi:MAG: S24 family peptidase [Acidobacteriota bacterium]|nr:S24 family peptidase [Acidobacteriota bacterium]
MPAAVISISDRTSATRQGAWSLLEMAQPGSPPVPLGILFVDSGSDKLIQRLREASEIDDIEEDEADVLAALGDDLRRKAGESGASRLLDSLEDSLSHFLRISDRTAITFAGDPGRVADRLFDEYVDNTVRPFVTHLPLYGLRAAATKFGESMDSEQEGWLRVPELRLTPDMFIARVVGRSMEPLIPDDSLCVFRAGVKGSRQGKRLLIEQFNENDFSNRYTVKRYSSRKVFDESGDWQHEEIRLEPLNPDFQAFTLSPDAFRVLAEFVAVLPD